MATIGQGVAGRGVEKIAGWDTDIFCFARLQHHLRFQDCRSLLSDRISEQKSMLCCGIVRDLQEDGTSWSNLEVNNSRGGYHALRVPISTA